MFTPNAFAAAPVRRSRANLAATSGDPRGGFGWARGGRLDEWQRQRRDRAGRRRRPGLGRDPRRQAARHRPGPGPAPVDRGHRHATAARAGGRRPRGARARPCPTTTPAWRPRPTPCARPTRSPRSRRRPWTCPAPTATPVPVTVSGIAKGVGMIHPKMATMLSVVLTDAAVEPGRPLVAPATGRRPDLGSAVGRRRHEHQRHRLRPRIGGVGGGARWGPGSAAAVTLGAAIEAVARDLARQQAADGEGATILITADVRGAADDADARAVARAVVSSSLVKAAAHGKDPNWGRIAGAAGNAVVAPVPPSSRRPACRRPRRAAGRASPSALDPDRAAHHDRRPSRVRRRPRRSRSPSTATRPGRRCTPRSSSSAWTSARATARGEAFGCDLTEQYVIENSEYTT